MKAEKLGKSSLFLTNFYKPLEPFIYYVKQVRGVFIPSPVRVGTLLSEVPGTPIGASFFEFELKPTGNDSADQTQHEFQHHIV